MKRAWNYIKKDQFSYIDIFFISVLASIIRTVAG